MNGKRMGKMGKAGKEPKEFSAEEVNEDDLLKIKLKVNIGKNVIESDIEDSLFIPTVDKLNPTQISNMMAEIPALHTRWNFLSNEAAYEYDIRKIQLEVWMAKKSKEYRAKLAQENEKRVTDKMVDEMIKMDPEYDKMNEDVAQAKKNMRHVQAQANGFGEKGERLVSIASMMKWEGETLMGVGKIVTKKHGHIEKPDTKSSSGNAWAKESKKH